MAARSGHLKIFQCFRSQGLHVLRVQRSVKQQLVLGSCKLCSGCQAKIPYVHEITQYVLQLAAKITKVCLYGHFCMDVQFLLLMLMSCCYGCVYVCGTVATQPDHFVEQASK